MLGINYVLRLMRHWHKLLEEDVGAPPLEDLKARLDGASDRQVWWVTTLPTASV